MNSLNKSTHINDLSRIEDSTQSESSIFVQEKSEENSVNNENYDQMDLKIEKEEIYSHDFTFGKTINSKSPRRIGNLYTFLFDKNGDPLIVIGPHWPFFACLSTTITIISFIFFYFLWNSLSIVIRSVGLLLYVLQISSYVFIFLKNPGLPLQRQQLRTMPSQLERGFKYCDQCHILVKVEEKTSHCDDCNVCIIGMNSNSNRNIL